MSASRGGPGGKYLHRSGVMTPVELREALADVRDQVEREPEVLDQLGAAILSRDLTTTSEILAHLRDLFTVLGALLRLVHVADADPGARP